MGKSKPGPVPSAPQKIRTLGENCAVVFVAFCLTVAVPVATVVSLAVR
jgi:hypothetical protein